MSLSNHKCSLGLDSSSFLPKKGDLCSKLLRKAKKLSLVSFEHPETFKHYRSYSTVVAEKQRQILEGGNYIIHPFSQFCLFWNSFIAFVNLIHMIVTTFRLCYILEDTQPSLHELDNIILALHCVCLFDIIIKFNIGFKETLFSNIVLDKSRISCRYFRRWFFFDIVSSLPIAYILLFMKLDYSRCLLVAHILPILKGARLRTSLNDIVTLIKAMSGYYILNYAIHHMLLFIVTMHWSCCLVYSPPTFSYYWSNETKEYNTLFLNSTNKDLTKLSELYRYQKALFLCLSSFFGTSMSMYKVHNPDEFIVHSIITLYAAMFMVYTTVLILTIYITAYNSKVRYHGLINQVEAYMRHKQFPLPLKKRVRIFFNYKFSEQYYKEDDVLHCLSGQLRNEIILQTYHKFVNKVKLFEDIPADVIGVLLSHLKPEAYLANDLIVRAGDIGDCMYFIGYGTVAVYSLKGAEVCHLEDGAYFGGVALLMKDNKRISTVVAIEITQLYRLDAVHFRYYIHAWATNLSIAATSHVELPTMITIVDRLIPNSLEGRCNNKSQPKQKTYCYLFHIKYVSMETVVAVLRNSNGDTIFSLIPKSKYLISNSIMRERLEVRTSKRMHETVMLDEAFRKQQEKKRDQLSTGPQSDISRESL